MPDLKLEPDPAVERAARLLVEARAPMIMTGSGARGDTVGEIGFPGSAQADQLRGGERRPQDLKGRFASSSVARMLTS